MSTIINVIVGVLSIALITLTLLIKRKLDRLDRQDLVTSSIVTLLSEPPSNLTPGAVGALLTKDANATWVQELADLLDLGRRGFLSLYVLPNPVKDWNTLEVDIHPLWTSTNNLRRSDRVILNPVINHTVFIKQGERQYTTISVLGSLACEAEKLMPYQDAVFAELVQAGLVSDARKAIRGRIRKSGWGSALVVGLLMALAVTFSEFAPDSIGLAFTLKLSTAIFLISLWWIYLSAKYTVFTSMGLKEAKQWRGFQDSLIKITKGETPLPGTEIFADYLPYAVSLNFGPEWTRFWGKQKDTPLPEWFQVFSNKQDAFEVLTRAISESLEASRDRDGGGIGVSGGMSGGQGGWG